MPFGTISSQSVDYNPRQPGHYSRSTVAFGDPADEFIVRGASVSSDGVHRASVARVLQKDVTSGSDSTRKQATVNIGITVPSDGFTAAELDSLANDISTFFTVDTITRLLQGES